jgi:hypothetical protein
MFDQGKFSICSRNLTLLEGNANCAHYFHVEKVYNIGAKMALLGRNLAIQGEVIGPKINGNKLGLSKLDFEVFNIFDIDATQYLNYSEVIHICTDLGLHHVPLLYIGQTSGLPLVIDDVVTTFGDVFIDINTEANKKRISDGLMTLDEANASVKKILGGLITMSNNLVYTQSNPAEGLVVKTNDTINARISFKVISQKFTLKHDKA